MEGFWRHVGCNITDKTSHAALVLAQNGTQWHAAYALYYKLRCEWKMNEVTFVISMNRYQLKWSLNNNFSLFFAHVPHVKPSRCIIISANYCGSSSTNIILPMQSVADSSLRLSICLISFVRFGLWCCIVFGNLFRHYFITQ